MTAEKEAIANLSIKCRDVIGCSALELCGCDRGFSHPEKTGRNFFIHKFSWRRGNFQKGKEYLTFTKYNSHLTNSKI
jgi:hypothetical protein